MEDKYFPLGNTDDNKLVRAVRIIFGIVCIVLAVFWLIRNSASLKNDGTLWITIVFLIAFGLFQIWAGTGHATRFIVIGPQHISLKKNSLQSPFRMIPEEMEKIEFFPLSIIFYFKSGKKNLLRFGTVNYETNEKIVDELISFAEANAIPFEIKEEEL
jgi:hypothetical protein